jgi:arylsulfatase A-like enzyme
MKTEVPRPTPIHPALLVPWFALVAAVLELLYMGVQKLDQHVIYSSLQVLWMAPLGYLILYSPLILLILGVRRVWPESPWFELSVVLSVALLGFGFLALFWVTLGPPATLLLTGGVTVQGSRMVLAHRTQFSRLVRRSLGWMLGTTVVMAVVLTTWPRVREYIGLRALHPGGGPPNVILLVLDTVRGMSMSLYGYPRQTTPELDRFAAQAVVFDNAYATASWTLPSIATMFTGKYAHEHGASWTRPLPSGQATLAEVFRDAGYATAGFVANVNYSSAEVGLSRGFVHFEDYTTSLSDILLSASPGRFVLNNPYFRAAIGFYDTFGRKDARLLNGAFLSWLGEHRQRPFFAYLNYYDAHEPYLPPVPFNTRFGPDTLRNKSLIRFKTNRDAHRINKRAMSAAERLAEEQAYDASIAYLDSQLGRLFAELDRLGLANNTVIIVTADHGELFGEHSLFTHGNSLYLPLLHVPLVLRSPTLPGGVRISTPVTLRDLARTIVDIAGLNRVTLPGSSFASLAGEERLAGPGSPIIAMIGPAPSTPPFDPVSKGPMWSVISPPHQYIVGGDGTEELYDFVRDPEQSINLAADPSNKAILERLRAVIDSVRPRR